MSSFCSRPEKRVIRCQNTEISPFQAPHQAPTIFHLFLEKFHRKTTATHPKTVKNTPKLLKNPEETSFVGPRARTQKIVCRVFAPDPKNELCDAKNCQKSKFLPKFPNFPKKSTFFGRMTTENRPKPFENHPNCSKKP